ncbi:MAG TPA: hypothetical protein VK838_04190, partial [Candidatus Limnocylindrales bacterium]|nr:hypothetical protein [Candidatus Limnocylindrales bacterium]
MLADTNHGAGWRVVIRRLSVAGVSLLLLTACSLGSAGSPANAAQAELLDRKLMDVVSGETFTLRRLAADRPVLLETM